MMYAPCARIDARLDFARTVLDDGAFGQAKYR